MERERHRREFLKTVGVLGIGSAVATGTASGATVAVSGTVVTADDEPVTTGRVRFVGPDGHGDGWLDDDGRFEVSLTSDSEYKMGYHKLTEAKTFAPLQNGAPHIDVVDEIAVGSGDRDLGTVQLPAAYPVDVRVLDASGNPVGDATLKVRGDGFGWTVDSAFLTDDGYFALNGADFTGLELGGQVTLTVKVPMESGANREFKKDLIVDGPTMVTVQLEKGVSVEAGSSDETVSSGEQNDGADGEGGGDGPSDGSGSDGSVDEDASGQTGGSEPDQSVEVEDGSESQSGDVEPGDSSTEVRRGFFSNGQNAESFGGLSDPFVLTVGGFLLSVVGILKDMITGE